MNILRKFLYKKSLFVDNITRLMVPSAFAAGILLSPSIFWLIFPLAILFVLTCYWSCKEIYELQQANMTVHVKFNKEFPLPSEIEKTNLQNQNFNEKDK